MVESSLFFLPLEKRPAFTVKADGSFYSYEYYRQCFRDEIAEQCQGRCVYCDSHEIEVGGRESMEIDHFRPWSRPEFAHLKDDPRNFHHACGRCNRLKGVVWPNCSSETCHDGLVGFVDPFAEDRRLYFNVAADGELICLRHPASYLSRLLQLNRPLLKLLRMRRILRHAVTSYIESVLPEIEAAERGQGSLSREELAAACKKLCDYNRLIDLCDAPLQRQFHPPVTPLN
jgi:hypothetical protein